LETVAHLAERWFGRYLHGATHAPALPAAAAR
jgi:hypothetical protein